MALIKFLITLIAYTGIVVLSAPCAAETAKAGAKDESKDIDKMVKRINERHDDFFKYERERDERAEKRDAQAGDRRRGIEKHNAAMEKAREEFVKNKREKPSTEKLRIEWEAKQKDRLAEEEMLRRRYVDKRDRVDQMLKKGRQIPEMKEFDLEEE